MICDGLSITGSDTVAANALNDYEEALTHLL